MLKENGNFIHRHAQTLALSNYVSLVHVYRNPAQKPFFSYSTQIEGGLISYVYSYKGRFFKFFLSAFLFYKAYKQACVRFGKVDLVIWNVFYPLAIHFFWLRVMCRKPNYAIEHWTGFLHNTPKFNPKHPHLLLAKFTSKFLNGIYGVSKNLNENMKLLGIKNIKGVIYNSVDTSIFYPKKDKPIQFNWIHVSSLLNDHKNVKLLIAAFSSFDNQCPNTIMTVVGGENHSEIKQLLESYKLAKKVNLIKATNIEAVAAEMQNSHALLLSSNYENMPCVIAEALCCGLPVITTQVGGVSEIIDKNNGLVVPINDLQQYTNAMKKIYQSYNNYNNLKIANEANTLFAADAILVQFNQILESEKG